MVKSERFISHNIQIDTKHINDAMNLANLVEKLSRKQTLQADSDLIDFLSLLQDEKITEPTVMHLEKKKEQTFTAGLAHIVYVHKPGDYVLNFEFPNETVMKTSYFKEPGVYFIQPFVQKFMHGDAVLESHKKLNLAPLNSRRSYEMALEMIQMHPRCEKPGVFEKAQILKNKRDAMPEDETNYFKEIFIQRPEKNLWKFYRPFIIGAAAATALFGIQGYFEEQASKNRDKGWRVEREAKELAFENNYARHRAIEQDRNAETAARQKEEAEKKRIWEEENKKRLEELRREQKEKFNAYQTHLKNEFQSDLRKAYKDIEISDFAWEAFCSDPVVQPSGPNWQSTFFKVQFKENAYSMSAYFHTDRYLDYQKSNSATHITTAFSLVKDEKLISFDEKGETNNPNLSETDKQYVREFVQKYKLAEVRKNVIDTIIEGKGHHRADVYKGRD